MVTGRGSRAPEDHFDISYELGIPDSRAPTRKNPAAFVAVSMSAASPTPARPMRPGHAILSGRPLIGDEPFAAVLADDLRFNLGGDGVEQMVKLYNQFRAPSSPSRKCRRKKPPDGVIAGELFVTTSTVLQHGREAEAGRRTVNLAIIGRYILTSDIFDLIQNTEPGQGWRGPDHLTC